MNKVKFQLLASAALLMAAATEKQLFDTGTSKIYIKPMPKKDLPKWEINGHTIFAKDEKTAIKYARKRGLMPTSTGADLK